MTELRKAAERALDALEDVFGKEKKDVGAINALRQALAQPEQEPVAWMTHINDLNPLFHKTRASALNWQTQPTPLFTAPPKREWVGLTRNEVYVCWKSGDVVAAVEAKLKEKNGG